MADSLVGEVPEWASSKEVQAAVLEFYRRYARLPKNRLIYVKRRLHPQLEELLKRGQLNNNGIPCERLDKVGSAYENVCVSHPIQILQLNVQLVLSGAHITVSPLKGRPFCVELTKEVDTEFPDLPGCIPDKRERLSNKKILEEYLETLRRHNNGTATFEIHGPAVRMTGAPWYTVDLVPSLNIPKKGYYVPARGRVAGIENEFAWVESFSIQEKEEFPVDCSWAKPCLRVIKAFCCRQPELDKLETYVLKNILFLEVEENLMDDDWYGERAGERVVWLLHRLLKGLQEGCIPQFFNWKVNVLEGIPQHILEVMIQRLLVICNDEQSFVNAFSVVTDES